MPAPALSLRRAAVVAALTLAAASHALGASAGVSVTTARLEGPDRYATAARIAADSFQDGAATAVLARGDDFADALGGASLAAFIGGAPVLLTTPARLPRPTEEALRTLGVTRVLLLGGRDAISAEVEQDLHRIGVGFTRFAGADRFDTAAQVAEACDECAGNIDGKRAALLVNGNRFGDALAAGPVAYDRQLPLLLTTRDALPPRTKQVLQAEINRYELVVIIGGPAVVSDAVADSIRGLGIDVERIAGPDRAATAVAVAEFAQTRLEWIVDHVNLARGDDFADALAGAAHAGREQAPILLASNPQMITPSTLDYAEDNRLTIDSIDVFGSRSAVSDEVVEQVRDAATIP